MELDQRFTVNEPTVIQEIIDAEAIIADLGRGFYYSLDAIGSQIWSALIAGSSAREIIDALAVRFDFDRENLAAGTTALLERLVTEALIVPRDDGALPAGHPEFDSLGGAFSAPVLSKYTDMEQLLLLDPIHDIDETGWPRKVGEAPEENTNDS